MWPYLISVYGMGIGKRLKYINKDGPRLMHIFLSYHLRYGSYGLCELHLGI